MATVRRCMDCRWDYVATHKHERSTREDSVIGHTLRPCEPQVITIAGQLHVGNSPGRDGAGLCFGCSELRRFHEAEKAAKRHRPALAALAEFGFFLLGLAVWLTPLWLILLLGWLGS